jgi:hypothetical protein
MKYPRRKKSSKIGEAVFRGKQSQYNFEVFPLTAEINDTPAIFVISRRITDKFRKGHHATVCLGETASVVAELKRHKRAKCVKQSAANVICILKENNESKRSSVVDDLKAARLFSCVRNADQPNIKAKLNVSTTRSRPKNIVSAPTEVKAATATRSSAKKAQPVKPAAKPTETKKSKAVKTKKVQPVKTEKPQPAKSKKSRLVKTVATKTTKAKAAKPAPAAKAKQIAKAKPAKSKKPSRVATAVASKRPTTKRASAAKPKAASPKRKTAAAKRPATTAAKPTRTSKTRTRVQSGVDSKRGQHRLSKPKKPVNRRTKSRTVSKPRSRQKAAA